MIRIVLLVALVACAKPAPVTPSSPSPRNLGCQQAQTIDKNAVCFPGRTSEPELPDVAIAEIGGGVLALCVAGPGMGASCVAFADLRPRKQEPPVPAPQPGAPAPKAEK